MMMQDCGCDDRGFCMDKLAGIGKVFGMFSWIERVIVAVPSRNGCAG
jgi:hypothetical protein